MESLLFLARNEFETDPPPMRCLALKDWLENQSQNWAPPARASDLKMDICLSDDAFVRATSALLGRVLDNLVSNAMKYSEPGSSVVVRASVKEGEAIIEVVDFGTGIAAEEIPKLFDPFFRSGEARRRGIAGTGLGLAIAHRIAITLGGHLECESTWRVGSCFRLRVPIQCTAPPPC